MAAVIGTTNGDASLAPDLPRGLAELHLHILIDHGHGPYYYLPKVESHLKARLWNDIFTFAVAELGIPHGTVRATVLIETIPAAFEMEERSGWTNQLDGETDRLRGEVDAQTFERYYLPARALVGELCTSSDFVDFLTLPAYQQVI